ncbi:hypothetical protein M2118_000459 [Aurantimicrobium minutum]|uniref:hypothetical protein n=1 Tax=Aurantimicrobium minutum TaxID=708131 RepID=UPI00247552D8|nr:hypothetical protein [Aurantimicrobium minutum]MDH6277508.1 hypothetical protein [Aurantimicrobium minutum]
MSNNTLTTERVRSSFIWAEEESPAHILPSVLREEFDRWLAGVKAQERQIERQRIMKLVQEQLKADPYNSVLRALEAGISQMPVKGETE